MSSTFINVTKEQLKRIIEKEECARHMRDVVIFIHATYGEQDVARLEIKGGKDPQPSGVPWLQLPQIKAFDASNHLIKPEYSSAGWVWYTGKHLSDEDYLYNETDGYPHPSTDLYQHAQYLAAIYTRMVGSIPPKEEWVYTPGTKAFQDALKYQVPPLFFLVVDGKVLDGEE